MIKAFFFDMDGTLVDSEPLWGEAYQWSLQQRGVACTPQEVAAITRGRSFYEIFTAIHEQWPGAFASVQEMGQSTTEFFEREATRRNLGIQPSLELLKRLADSGLPIYVVSGSVQERVRRNLQDYGVWNCVTGVVSSDDYQRGKPQPDAYLTALDKAGVEPEECVVFEDALTGVIAAKRAGCWCVALNRLREPDYAAARLADLTLEELSQFSLAMLAGERPATLEKHRIALGLGGNLGDTARRFQEAQRLLEQGGCVDIRRSALLVTKPVDCIPGTPDFLNGALTGTWFGTPLDLLNLTQTIERTLGRPQKHSSRESRTLDLDILLVDDCRLAEPTLTVPHPRMTQRRFVLEPLAEIAPDWAIPPQNITVRQALEQLD